MCFAQSWTFHQETNTSLISFHDGMFFSKKIVIPALIETQQILHHESQAY